LLIEDTTRTGSENSPVSTVHGANIPPKRNRKGFICFSPYLYRARNLAERFFNRIKQCWRAATRYDKLAANYLAFIKLAAIRIWLRAYESTP
jgi:transposase